MMRHAEVDCGPLACYSTYIKRTTVRIGQPEGHFQMTAITPTTPIPANTTWTVDPVHSTIGFAVKHMVVDRRRLGLLGVGVAEETSRDQPNPHRLEVAGQHGTPVRFEKSLVRRHGDRVDGDRAGIVAAAERQDVDRSCRLDAGQHADAIERLAIEQSARQFGRIFQSRQRDAERQDPVGSETWVHDEKAQETAAQQSGAGQEHER